ncbi:MAG: response regulator [Candidatus Thiodiazotropha endolucinida]
MPANRNLRLLIAEDSSINRYLIDETLKRAGYDVYMHESGESALDQLLKDPVDVAILDMQMPVVTGIDIVKQVRKSKQECRDAQDAKRDIPVPLSPSLVTTAY